MTQNVLSLGHDTVFFGCYPLLGDEGYLMFQRLALSTGVRK